MDLQQRVDKIVEKTIALGVSNVYFEPPEDLIMEYPCVRFKRGTISSRHADNRIYKIDDSFDYIYISRISDDKMAHTILVGDSEHEPPFRRIRHIRHYVADGLHHDHYKLYY